MKRVAPHHPLAPDQVALSRMVEGCDTVISALGTSISLLRQVTLLSAAAAALIGERQIPENTGLDRLVPPITSITLAALYRSVSTMIAPVNRSATAEASGSRRPVPTKAFCQRGFSRFSLDPIHQMPGLNT